MHGDGVDGVFAAGEHDYGDAAGRGTGESGEYGAELLSG